MNAGRRDVTMPLRSADAIVEEPFVPNRNGKYTRVVESEALLRRGANGGGTTSQTRLLGNRRSVLQVRAAQRSTAGRRETISEQASQVSRFFL